MNRTVAALTNHPELFDEISDYFEDGQDVVYLVTDDAFCSDAQIWTLDDRDDILEDFARIASQDSRTPHRSLNQCRAKVRRDFESSTGVYLVYSSDLDEARAALEDAVRDEFIDETFDVLSND